MRKNYDHVSATTNLEAPNSSRRAAIKFLGRQCTKFGLFAAATSLLDACNWDGPNKLGSFPDEPFTQYMERNHAMQDKEDSLGVKDLQKTERHVQLEDDVDELDHGNNEGDPKNPRSYAATAYTGEVQTDVGTYRPVTVYADNGEAGPPPAGEVSLSVVYTHIVNGPLVPRVINGIEP